MKETQNITDVANELQDFERHRLLAEQYAAEDAAEMGNLSNQNEAFTHEPELWTLNSDKFGNKFCELKEVTAEEFVEHQRWLADQYAAWDAAENAVEDAVETDGQWESIICGDGTMERILIFPNSTTETLNSTHVKVPSQSNGVWYVRARCSFSGMFDDGTAMTEFTILEEPLVGTFARYYYPIDIKDAEYLILRVSDLLDGIWLCEGVYQRRDCCRSGQRSADNRDMDKVEK